MNISIDDIKNSKDHSLKINFENSVKDLATDGSVTAELIFSAFDSYIQVKGTIVANVKLICDRCLKDFVKKIEVDVDETYMLGSVKSAKEAHSGQEIELKDGDFITELHGQDYIDVDDLIYQSVTLNIPNPCVCDINCWQYQRKEQVHQHKDTEDLTGKQQYLKLLLAPTAAN